MLKKVMLVVLLAGALALYFTSISGCEDNDVGDCSGALDTCDRCQEEDDRNSCIDGFEQCSLAKDSRTIQDCCDQTQEIWLRNCEDEYM